jgi:hypothetical protein
MKIMDSLDQWVLTYPHGRDGPMVGETNRWDAVILTVGWTVELAPAPATAAMTSARGHPFIYLFYLLKLLLPTKLRFLVL